MTVPEQMQLSREVTDDWKYLVARRCPCKIKRRRFPAREERSVTVANFGTR